MAEMDKETVNALTRVGFIASGIVVFIIGLLLVIESELDQEFGIITFLALAAIIGNYAYYTGQAKEGGDERVANIASKAMSTSWYLTLLIALGLLAVIGMGALELTIAQIFGIALMVMVPSMVIYNEIMVRRGD